MASTLVATKLNAPRLRGALVPRTADLSWTAPGRARSLRRFGKTTVLASWLERASTEPRTVASVSLDESDSQAASFWLYVVTALSSAAPGRPSVLPLLTAGQPASRTLLTVLLNEIGALATEVDLILDDYHLADGADVAEGMTFLLDHRPPNLHVVVSTRADPDLPLARLRARGELVEIRARDLRFTVDGDRVVPHRRRRARGRADRRRGARVAHRGLGRRAPARGAVDAGSRRRRRLHRRVRRRPTGTSSTTSSTRCSPASPTTYADFLLRTSVLDPLCGDLCDAVARADRQPRDARVARAREPVPRAARRPAAAGTATTTCSPTCSQAHLRDEQPGASSRACTCARAGGTTSPDEPVPAVRHALAAGDVDRAADLVEAALPALQRDRQEAVIRGWIDDFPDDVVRAPAGARHRVRRRADVEQRVRRRRAAAARRGAQLPAIERAHRRRRRRTGGAARGGRRGELARVPAAVELYRAGHVARSPATSRRTHRHAQRAIDTSAGRRRPRPGGGVRACRVSRTGRAASSTTRTRRYTACIDGPAPRRARLGRARLLPSRWPTSASPRADCATRRRPTTTALRARRHGRRCPARGRRHARRPEPGGARAWRARRGARAARRRARARRGARPAAVPLPARGRPRRCSPRPRATSTARSRSWPRRSRSTSATSRRTSDRCTPSPRGSTSALGDLDAALRWARDHDVTSSQDLSYLREFEHVTLAEVLLARHRRDGGTELLDEADGAARAAARRRRRRRPGRHGHRHRRPAGR